MKSITLSVRAVLLVVCTIWWTVPVQAQFRASLRGTVTDPQGAVVPRATVTPDEQGHKRHSGLHFRRQWYLSV